jgi:DNA-binding response OmpR family regulator
VKKILVVDDEQEILNLFRRFLSRLGYDATVTDSWETALQKFADEVFDLIILDVHMPGKDGFQLAKEIKKAKPGQKILMITGLGAGDAYKYLSSTEVDVTELLYKPFSVQKLELIVTKILADMENGIEEK